MGRGTRHLQVRSQGTHTPLGLFGTEGTEDIRGLLQGQHVSSLPRQAGKVHRPSIHLTLMVGTTAGDSRNPQLLWDKRSE
ncbi:hypothetical protein GCM10008955_17880 [Deinococcus malanensis]|uniref:Uncharacterized protein n=1 Tax=Deinococcus malanensis TaxID=1706855 RepID=A0ABQ2EU12_9DEIO|nr:hypothetical protein GCM10008955_17880 [Deinococcus malanensis]